MRSKSLSLVLAALAAVSLAACSGGSKNSSSTSTTTTTTTTQSSPAAGTSPAASPAAGVSPAASPASTSAAMSGNGMAPSGPPAPIPASLHCEGGQAPVWANTSRHVYHMAADPYYGRTKHGKYLCLRDAVNAGYHAAGSRHHNAMNPGSGAQPAASPATP